MSNLHTDDSFMYKGMPIGDAMQKAWENCMLDDYETPKPKSSVETDPLVNRITHQRGPKVPPKSLAESMGLRDDALSAQIGGTHYAKQKIQPVEFIHANNLGFCEGNCIKYLCRWQDKGGLQDLEKAKHYTEMLIQMESK